MDPRGLLLDLETYYQGLGAEYLKDRDHARDDDEGDVVQEPHLRLRSTETVPALFGYQKELVEAFEQACFSPREENIALLALPTGAGKTRTAAVALLKILTSGRASLVLWLAPTRELLEQAAATLETVWHSYRNAAVVGFEWRKVLLTRLDPEIAGSQFLSKPGEVHGLEHGQVSDGRRTGYQLDGRFAIHGAIIRHERGRRERTAHRRDLSPATPPNQIEPRPRRRTARTRRPPRRTAGQGGGPSRDGRAPRGGPCPLHPRDAAGDAVAVEDDVPPERHRRQPRHPVVVAGNPEVAAEEGGRVLVEHRPQQRQRQVGVVLRA